MGSSVSGGARPRRGGCATAGCATAGWAVGVVCLSLFLALGLCVALHAAFTTSIDGVVARWGYHDTYGHAALRAWWRDVATFGQPTVLRLLLIAIAAVQAWRRHWVLAAWLVGVVAVEGVVAPMSKLVLRRPRPAWAHPIVVEHSFSFPSGHAAAAGMFLAAVALTVVATRQGRLARYGSIAIATLVTLLVAASRVFLGVHYLTDVVAGLLLGGTLSLVGFVLAAGILGPTLDR